MYRDIVKIAFRRIFLVLLQSVFIMGYAFLMLWLSLLPLSHFWSMLWPLWSLWFVLVIWELFPAHLSLLLAFLLGIILDSLLGNFIGIHAFGLLLINYLKHYLRFMPSVSVSEKFNEVVLIIIFSFLYQLLIGALQWITRIPTQMIGSHILGTSITTSLVWYYCTAQIKKVNTFFTVDGPLLARWLS